jgi:hypothetical protein
VLQHLVERLRLRLAARHYARRLGPRLYRDYGGGEEYSAGQIRAAAHKVGLTARFLKIGYAAFMTRESFEAVMPADAWSEYEALRALFRHYRPSQSHSDVSPPPEINSYV